MRRRKKRRRKKKREKTKHKHHHRLGTQTLYNVEKMCFIILTCIVPRYYSQQRVKAWFLCNVAVVKLMLI
jgi:hypothetical protein